MLGLDQKALKRLEPDDAKVSSPVLRGRRRWRHLLCYPTLIKTSKKQITMTVAIMLLWPALGSSETCGGFTSGGFKSESIFRPSFLKKLKKVKALPSKGFRHAILKESEKKTVFINWKALYWGKLSDLVYGPDETEEEGILTWQPYGQGKGQDYANLDTEETQSFARELREELKAFAKTYNLRIVWNRGKRKGRPLPDATTAFLEYWDRGFSEQGANQVPSFEELVKIARDTFYHEEGKRIQSSSLKKGEKS